MSAGPAHGVCRHCGTRFRPAPELPDFCCSGCRFVHDLIRESGLGRFYELKDAPLPPVQSLVFHRRDWSWLEKLAREAESAERPSLELGLQGVSCIGCVWLIERVFQKLPGAAGIEVDPTAGRCSLRWRRGELDLPAFARQLQSYGYLLGPPRAGDRAASRALVVRMGLCGALAMNAMIFSLPIYLGMEPSFELAWLFRGLVLLFGALSMAVGGSWFILRAARALRRGVVHIDLPISLGLLAAFAGSLVAWGRDDWRFTYFDFVSIFTFLMLVGRWLQQRAVERNRNLLLDLHAGPPPVAPLRGETPGPEVPSTSLRAGDRYELAPGRVVPVRSRLLSEGVTLGFDWINGEAEPGAARRGQLVPSGAAHLGQAPARFEALEEWPRSALAALLAVSPRGAFRNPALERFIRAYLVAVVAVAAAGFAAWWALGAGPFAALQVLVSVLVVSCPCALGVAVPLADELAVSRLRRAGVFVRDHFLWPRLLRVRKVLFDKTGTLTLQSLALRNPEALDRLAAPDASALLAMVQDSLHPVSGCLREALLLRGVVPGTLPVGVRETVGSGLECGPWRLGRPGWSTSTDGSERPAGRSPAQASAPSAAEATAESEFSRDGETLARFAFSEEARPDAAAEVAALRAAGREIRVLSGDRQHKVDRLARELGLEPPAALGELSPADKAARVREIDRGDTLFVGDGANDSLAFREALCTATPAVDRGLLEHRADFYFLGRGLSAIRLAFEMAERRRRAVRRVIGFAILYNAGAVALCLAGRMNPLVAAGLMPLSSIASLWIVAAGFRERS